MHNSTTVNMLLRFFLFFSLLAFAAPRPHALTEHVTPSIDKRQSSSYWMETIQRQGQPAYNTDKSYKVFRNVRSYGAKGDGQTDDTDAINQAIADGNRCGATGNGDCDSSTITPAIVYFPAGTYKISKPIIMLYYTEMIGDGTNLPSIVGGADWDCTGLALIDADPYLPGQNGRGYYGPTNQFYRQIRNIIIDMTQMPESCPGAPNVNGVHWQVSQACSMQNVVFDMRPPSATNTQQGIFMENGSGMFMSDVVFNGGNVGAYLGSQQFTFRNFTFNGCGTAAVIIWDWLWTLKSLNIQNCAYGLNISTTNSVNETLGSALLMDSKISTSKAAIITSWGPNIQPEAGSTFLIHNVDFTGSNVAVMDARSGNTVLPGKVKIAAWGQGNAYAPADSTSLNRRMPQGSNPESTPTELYSTGDDMEPFTSTVTVSPLPQTAVLTASSAPSRPASTISGFPTGSNSRPPIPSFTGSSSRTLSSFPSGSNATAAVKPTACSSSAVIPTQSRVTQQNINPAPLPSSLITADGSVFERSKPQYIGEPAANFISVKTFGATGDGSTDDSDAIQKAMDSVTANQILYFDHGAYVITKTIDVPSTIRIVGEIWPMIMIKGQFFSDQTNPQPGFRVGKAGDTGSVEISDMMFETLGPAPGAIMMEWNVEETSQGSCGMWDSHFRVGGSAGTELQQAQCDSRSSQAFRAECAGSFLMLHVTQSASAYVENSWFWVADHDLDLSRQEQPRQANETQVSIYNGRGVLVESQGPTWLWGTSSEHSVFYNYQVANAKNVFMGAIQTETAYMQPVPNSLESGFTPNSAYSDPDFANCTDDSCKMTWGLRIIDSQDIFIFGGGLYSFFQNYQQECLDTDSCQTNMIEIQCSTGIYMYTFATKAATAQLVVDGQVAIFEKDNPNAFAATVLLYEQP